MLSRRKLLAVGCGVGIAVCAYAYFVGGNLYVNGSLASSNVIDVKGTAYVPIKDVAKALNMTVTKTSRGFEMGPAGGANMVGGLTGKVGDELFNGFHRFKVVEVIRGKSYTNRFSGDNQAITPYPEGDDLVVVICRIKNATKTTENLGLPGGELTALTDMDEHSISPRNGVSIDVPSRGPNVLPGAAVDFALTFDVPAGAKLKDLVYDVQDFEVKHKSEPFRVTLQGQ